VAKTDVDVLTLASFSNSNNDLDAKGRRADVQDVRATGQGPERSERLFPLQS